MSDLFNNPTDMKQREAAIFSMLLGIPAAANLGRDHVRAMALATVGNSLESVILACKRFDDGLVPNRDNDRMPPSSGELMQQVRMIDAGIRARDRKDAEFPPAPDGYRRLPTGEVVVPIGQPVPEGYATNGLVEIDLGHGKIDLRGLTPAEKRAKLESHGETDIKRLAGSRPLPRLQRMGK